MSGVCESSCVVGRYVDMKMAPVRDPKVQMDIDECLRQMGVYENIGTHISTK